METADQLPETVALIVFAKTVNAPVKTRIAATEGEDTANRIYRELLAVTAETIGALSHHVAFTGDATPGMLQHYFNNATSFFCQTGTDLGTRMKNACLHCNALGYSNAVIIGCDCPDRTREEILLAAQHIINGYNVVLGPVEDGGYHLAGVDASGIAIFEATQWSTPTLLKETEAIITANNLKHTLLSVRNDIDTIADYQRWRAGATEH